MKSKILLIDSNALVHRAYHALPADMATKDGQPTGAIYGFSAALLNAIETIKPTSVICCFDVSGKTFRHALYKDYKATRKEMEPALAVQVPRIHDVVEAFGFPIVTKVGFEADDLIGTLAKKFESISEVIILTGDRDELQLVSKNTSVMMFKQGITKSVVYDPQLLHDEYGLSADEFVVYKALRGDTSDNIPGVSGIGEVTAQKLVSSFHTLDDLYEAVLAKDVRINASVLEKLRAGKEIAYLSYQLSKIDCDVPLDAVPEPKSALNMDTELVNQLFEQLQFQSLIKRIVKLAKQPAPGLNLFDNVTASESDHVKVIDVNEMMQKIESTRGNLAVFITFSGISARGGQVSAIAISSDGESAHACGVTSKDLKQIRAVLHQTEARIIWWDAKAMMHLMPRMTLRSQDVDLLIVGQLVNDQPDFNSHISADNSAGSVTASGVSAITLWQASRGSLGALKSMRLESVWLEIEKPLIAVLYQMERVGITVDPKSLHQMSEDMTKQIADLESDIWKSAGEQFNVASPQQLGVILFEKLQLSTIGVKKKTNGFSTDVATLESLQQSHPIINLIMQYRELAKLKNTYVDVLPKLIDENDGRIHTTYNQIGAATGRLSSNDPNLQNIPIRSELGNTIRRSFVAEPKHLLLSLDYSQFELRILAHLSHDTRLIEHFKAGVDIHSATAAAVHDIPLNQVTKEQRRAAKAINFGLLYGLSAHRLAINLNIEYKTAQLFIERYFATFSKVKSYMQSVKDQATKDGFYTTLYGRRRDFPELKSSVWAIRQAGERMVMNFPMQGTQADMLKMAMIKVGEHLQSWPHATLLLTVHDELVLEVESDKVNEATERIKKVMIESAKLDVPIEISASVGQNWGEMTDV